MNETNPLGTDNLQKLILRFAIPSVVGMLVSALYNIVDQIFIGQGVGMLGNAATNVAFPLSIICTSLALLVGIGGASNFNLAMGKKEPEKARLIASNTITLLLTFGILLCLSILIFLKPLMLFFGATPGVLPYALEYTSITAFGFPFLLFTTGISSLIRADGSPKYAMICMLTGAIINTILDPLFIFVFKWGISGAAYATVISQIISAGLAIRYLFRFRTVSFQKEGFILKWPVCKTIFALGTASCFNQLAMMVVQIAMNNSLTYYGASSAYGSEIPLAVAGIINKTVMIFLSFAIGIAQGCQPIIGYNYGAKNYERVKQTYKTEVKMVLAILTVAFMCFQLFPRQIVHIFGEGTEMYYQFAERYFRIFLLMTFINGIQPITANFFTSIGKAYKGIFISMTRQIIFLLPLIALLPMFLGIDGIMYSGPIADGASFLVAVILIRKEMKNIDRLSAAL